MQRDGTLRRVHQPVNTMDPYKSLLTPLYNCDIDRMMKATKQTSVQNKSLATVTDTDEKTEQ